MQRYFYAGLFKRARSMGVTDILNQLPLVFKNYIKTDMTSPPSQSWWCPS